MAPANRPPNSRHREFPKRRRQRNRGQANMMNEVEVDLLVEAGSLPISLFHPKPIMEANTPFLIGPRGPIVEAALRHHPNEIDTVIGV